MCYRIEFVNETGNVRYVDQYYKATSEPYYWKNFSAADNVLATLNRKDSRYTYRCVEKKSVEATAAIMAISDPTVIPQPATASTPEVSTATATATAPEKKRAKPRHSAEDIPESQMLLYAIKTVAKYLLNLPEEIAKNADIASRESRKQEDLLHYIELARCDAVESSKIYKELKKVREDRRVAKDMLDLLNALDALQLSEGAVKKLICAVDTKIDREYSPRELPELFEKKK